MFQKKGLFFILPVFGLALAFEGCSQDNNLPRQETRTKFNIVNVFVDVPYRDRALLRITPDDPFEAPPEPLGRLESIMVGSDNMLSHGPENMNHDAVFRKEVEELGQIAAIGGDRVGRGAALVAQPCVPLVERGLQISGRSKRG